MSIYKNPILNSTFKVKNFDDAKLVCNCISANPNIFIPISFYDYPFYQTEISRLIKQYQSLSFLIFLTVKNNPNKWEKCIMEHNVINISLCIWLHGKKFTHDCLINAAIKFDDEKSFDFCTTEKFDISFLSMENFIKSGKTWNCTNLITALINESDIDFCMDVLNSSPEGFILELILENDNSELFSKYIITYLNILYSRFFGDRLKYNLKKIVDKGKDDYNVNVKINSYTHNFNKFKAIFHSLIVKLKLFSEKESKCPITCLNVEDFYPLDDKEPQNFADFLMTSKNLLLYANKYVSEEKRSCFLELIKQKMIKKFCHYNSVKCAKIFFAHSDFNIKKESLKNTYDIIIKCMNKETQQMFFEKIAAQFCNLETTNLKSFYLKVLIESSDLDEIKLQNFCDSVYYPGIMDDAVKTDNLEIVKFLHDKLGNYTVHIFKNIKSVEMLKLLNSYGFFVTFSNIQNEPYKCFFYDEIPRCILMFLLETHDNIIFDRVSITIINLVDLIGIRQIYYSNFHKRHGPENDLSRFNYKTFLPTHLHEKFIKCEESIDFFIEAKNNYVKEELRILKENNDHKHYIKDRIESALKKQKL